MNHRRIFLAASLAMLVPSCGGETPPAKPPTTTATTPDQVKTAAGQALPAPKPPRVDASLIDRKTLFGNPERAAPRVSPDGKLLAWLAPKDGVMNIFVAPVADPSKAKAVTDEKGRPVPYFFWAYDNKHVLYALDKNGDENVHVYSVDVASSALKDLTPFEKTQGRVQEVSDRSPGTVVLAMNDRDPKYHDLYKVDLATGNRTLLVKNEGGYAGFITDDAFKVRYAEKSRTDGGMDILVADGKGGFSEFQTISQEDSMTTGPVGFEKAGTTLYMRESRGRDTGSLVALDTKTNKPKVLAEDPRADAGMMLFSPADGSRTSSTPTRATASSARRTASRSSPSPRPSSPNT